MKFGTAMVGIGVTYAALLNGDSNRPSVTQRYPVSRLEEFRLPKVPRVPSSSHSGAVGEEPRRFNDRPLNEALNGPTIPLFEDSEAPEAKRGN